VSIIITWLVVLISIYLFTIMTKKNWWI
jgi:hypothetical protein